MDAESVELPFRRASLIMTGPQNGFAIALHCTIIRRISIRRATSRGVRSRRTSVPPSTLALFSYGSRLQNYKARDRSGQPDRRRPQAQQYEDSYLYWEPDSDEEFRRKGRLAVIADGMGGYEGGQEASRIAVETVRHVYDHSFGVNPQDTLLQAFESAHQNIQRYATEHPQFYGMGTTCTALSIVDRQLHFAHVGDSRLYHIRAESISRLTRDHSFVGRLVESGIVRSEDAESHPQRHILPAALGSGREVAPHVPDRPFPLEEGDTLVL